MTDFVCRKSSQLASYICHSTSGIILLKAGRERGGERERKRERERERERFSILDAQWPRRVGRFLCCTSWNRESRVESRCMRCI
jgi:hypothetical protein